MDHQAPAAAPNQAGTSPAKTGPIAATELAADRLPDGTLLQGRYRITGLLGVGGMSIVYKALDLHFSNVERVCAIKEMFYRGTDERDRRQRLESFDREAGLLAVLSHPAIPKIYDYFAAGGRAYLVQEFVPGRNLEVLSRQRGKGIPEVDLRDWGMQICDVLIYLHGQQPHPIVFRDLKPSNIMLGPHGALMVIDFGIARALQRTQRGTMIGTEGYAAPEQYRGIADPRVDVYALGATLHHLATADDPRYQTPFTFDQRRPRMLNPEISERLEQVILKAVAYAADERYPSALELKLALRGTGTAHATAPAATVLVPPPIPPLPRLTGTSLDRTTKGPGPVRVSAPVTERLLWAAATGDEVRGGGAVSGPLVLIGSYDTNLYALARATGAIRWRYPTGRGICAAPAVYQELAVVGSEDGTVYGVTIADGRQKWRFRTNMPVRSSPRLHGPAVFTGSDDGYLYKLEAANGELLWRCRTYGPVRSSAACAETMVYIGSDDGFLYGLEEQTGRQLWRFATAKPVLASPIVVGDMVVCASMDGSVYGLGARLGEQRWRFDTGGPVVASPTSSDGRLFIGSSTGKLSALDVERGEVVWTATCGGKISSTAALSGTRVYLGGLDGIVYCLDRSSGRIEWQHDLGRPVPAAPVLDPTGQVVYIGCTDGKVYALATGEAAGTEAG